MGSSFRLSIGRTRLQVSSMVLVYVAYGYTDQETADAIGIHRFSVRRLRESMDIPPAIAPGHRPQRRFRATLAEWCR